MKRIRTLRARFALSLTALILAFLAAFGAGIYLTFSRSEYAEVEPKPERGTQCGGADDPRGDERRRRRQRTGRDRSMSLQRMLPIRLTVSHVVQEVDDAGQRAEHDECGRRVQHRWRVEEALAEEQATEDDEVLGPLRRTQRTDEAPHERRFRCTDPSLAQIGLIDDVRNTVSRHLERGGYVRGLANRRNS